MNLIINNLFNILDNNQILKKLYLIITHLKLVHCKTAQTFFKQLGKVAFVTGLKKFYVAGVLINLPRTEDMLGGFDAVRTAVPRNALVV